MSIEVPVLLIAFNRPELTKKSFSSISLVEPTKLYIAIDGPREGFSADINLCSEVLEIVKCVNWKCDVQYLVRDQNIGCKNAVYDAITWAFRSETSLIIIEDDVVAPPSFFHFMQLLLCKYELNNKIAMISGNQYTPTPTNFDYLFTRYGHIWGWATWKRVWDKFDLNVPYLDDILLNELSDISFLSKREKIYHLRTFRHVNSLITQGTINTWDHQFVIFRLVNGLLSIAPRSNLASNIGFESSRSNYNKNAESFYFKADASFVCSRHPIQLVRDISYDSFHFDNFIFKKRSIVKRIIDKIIFLF